MIATFSIGLTAQELGVLAAENGPDLEMRYQALPRCSSKIGVTLVDKL